MSSALAMVLAAGMAVPGSGPEKVSGKTVQLLDLRGEWEGTWINSFGPADVKLRGNWLRLGGRFTVRFSYSDAGEGKLRLVIADYPRTALYRRAGSNIIICWSTHGKEWPDSIRVTENQEIYILHRVKPGK
jgi:hypothetical protein